MGRPRLKIDPEQVRKMAMIGCTMKGMALVLDCSVDTLERNFADVIAKGREQGKSALRQKQYEVALKGNVSMLIWLGKNMLDQSDQIDVTTSTDTKAIEQTVGIVKSMIESKYNTETIIDVTPINLIASGE